MTPYPRLPAGTEVPVVVKTDFQTSVYVDDVRTTLRATYLILTDGSTVRVTDSMLKRLQGVGPAAERMP